MFVVRAIPGPLAADRIPGIHPGKSQKEGHDAVMLLQQGAELCWSHLLPVLNFDVIWIQAEVLKFKSLKCALAVQLSEWVVTSKSSFL